MSKEQQHQLDEILRHAPLDLGGDLDEQRPLLEELLRQVPLAPGATTSPGVLGGVPVVEIGVDGAASEDVIVYLHGGAYAMGSALAAAGLASDVGGRSRTRVVSVDYRLAPEHPFPAALVDAMAVHRALIDAGTAPNRIAFVGESAGGGLAVASLVALRDEGAPLPGRVVVFSPWTDLSLSGDSVCTRSEVDPSVTAAGLRRRAADYLAAAEATDPLVSPVFADLHGLPPMLIQVGGNEVLLDDAVRLAARAAAHDVAVVLEVTPGVPHVFQAFAALLTEAEEALDRVAEFLLRGRLPVTAA